MTNKAQSPTDKKLSAGTNIHEKTRTGSIRKYSNSIDSKTNYGHIVHFFPLSLKLFESPQKNIPLRVKR